MTARTDRGTVLRNVADSLVEEPEIADAWLAKSFTDRVRERLAAHGLRGANEVYRTDCDHPSAMGDAGSGHRHRFVDIRTRGEYQSYVVD
jgi:hypothetical protein